jgi:hypothetical protein
MKRQVAHYKEEKFLIPKDERERLLRQSKGRREDDVKMNLIGGKIIFE